MSRMFFYSSFGKGVLLEKETDLQYFLTSKLLMKEKETDLEFLKESSCRLQGIHV